jgi:hypothetical protein
MVEMYASAGLFSSRRDARPVAKLLASLTLCALTSACAGNPFQDTKVDPASPVAAEVAKAGRTNQAYPSFASIPAAPKDMRPARQYGREAEAVVGERTDLERKTAPETWSLNGTDDFAAKARVDAGQEAAPENAGQTAAFANTQRKRATPPPPPKR